MSQSIQQASADAEAYIAEYNVWMHHLLDAEGRRLFPSGLRLISHWNLRDDLKARYAEKDGLAKQRMIAQVMERIVTQTIPQSVVDNPRVDWSPFSNRVAATPSTEIEASASSKDSKDTPKGAAPSAPSSDPEPDTRYARLLATFRAVRQADPHSPLTPTHIARRFEEDRELPEVRVKELFAQILGSPLVPRIAHLIEQRLGRKLEPFDIWYNGFQARGKFAEPELDAIVKKKYPDVAAYQADIPRLLKDLGFRFPKGITS